MTLDLEKFISNSIKMQAKIQHLEMSTKTVKKIPESVKDMIVKDYGEKYLEDADYVSFFWGALGKEQIEKLFNVVDKALGKSANKLTATDFKKISFGSGQAEEVEDEVEDDIDDDSDDDSETEEIEDEVEVDVDGNNDDSSSEDESLDEDEDAVVSQPKTSYFFLKITLK